MSNTPYATFAADVIAAGMSRDRRAAARVKEFVTSAEFAVTKANAALPTIGRGDAYGDGPISATPVLDFSMAPLDNGNPQSVPHWSSEGNLAGAHTEGTAPTDGTFVVAGQTVTPAPISGVVTISRELIDAGGNPRANELVWARMQAAYLKVAEQKAAAALAAATLTEVAAVGIDAALYEDLCADLFGLAIGSTTQDLSELLIGTALGVPLEAARSTAGERLVPIIPGQPPRMEVGVRVGTVAWSLAASYLARPGSFVSLVSIPQRLEFSTSVAGVQVAIWGYSAHLAVDTSGIRRLTYAAA